MNVSEGVLSNYFRVFPDELERLFEAIEYIIEYGSGGAVLETLSKRTFRDTKSSYLNRIKKEALSRKDGLRVLCRALLNWYETWKDSFSNFNAENAESKFQEQPMHTWVHCLMTGNLHIYQGLVNEEFVAVEKSKWNQLNKEIELLRKNRTLIEKDTERLRQTDKMERLLRLYEKDKDVRIKEKLFERKIAIFLQKKWPEEQIEDLKRKYHFSEVKQFSSITPVSDIGDFDYYLLLTSQASHAVKFFLESKVSKERIFFVNSLNVDRVMEEWINQLKGI